MAAPRRGICVLRERQRLALRDGHLPAHEIDAGDQLGDRVLDLEARVHLQEVEAARRAVEQELERAGADVADRRAPRAPRPRPSRARISSSMRRATASPRSPSGGAAGSSSRARTGGPRCRAVAEDLDLDVARPHDRLLEVDRVVAERASAPRAARPSSAASSLSSLVDEAHALAAAAGRRLQHHRVADLRAAAALASAGAGEAVPPGPLSPGTTGTPARLHLRARRRLGAHRADRRRRAGR